MEIKPERRRVVVLFGDIKGFTPLAELMDPEDLQELVDSIFGRFKELVERNGGYLDKFIGDAVMAVFGAPVAYGDDARRAIATAISMQRYLGEVNSERGTEIKMRIGINAGEVLWSSIAGEKPTVLGDAVNVAQRIEDVTEPGKIYVSESVFNLAFQYYFFKEVGPVSLKGKSEPVKVFEVITEKPAQSEFLIRGRFKTPFLGREEELKEAEDFIKSKFSESGLKIVNFIGEAGVGKTRFCVELAALLSQRFSSKRVYFIRCDPTSREPLFAFKKVFSNILKGILPKDIEVDEALSSYLKKVHGLLEFEADLISSRLLLFLRGEVELSRDLIKELESILTDMLNWLLKDLTYLIIFIDDTEYLDEESKAFLKVLKAKLQGGSLIMAFISRELVESIPADRILELKPLGESFVIEVCKTFLKVQDNEISDDFVSFTLEKTKGNPYFIEELIYFLKEQDLLEYNPLRLKSEDISIPDTISGLLIPLIDALPSQHKEILKTASVIGSYFWRGLLERIVGKSVIDSLDFLEKEGFILSKGFSEVTNSLEYAFRNELMREAAYSLVTKKEREKIHFEVSKELEKLEVKDENILFIIAHHYQKAGYQELANDYYEKAGDLSFNKGFYSYALKAFKELEINEVVAFKIAQCLEGLGDYQEAIKFIENFYKILSPDSDLFLKYKILLASIYSKLSRQSEALNLLEKIDEIKYPEIKAYATFKRAEILWMLGRYEEAANCANLSLKVIEENALSSRDALRALGADLNLLGNISQLNGNYQDALQYYEKAKSIVEDIGEILSQAKVQINISQIYLYYQDYVRAEKYLLDTLEVVKKSGSLLLMGVVLNNLGRVYQNTMDYEKAVDYYVRAISIFKNKSLFSYAVDTTINLASVYIYLSKFSSAEALLREILSSEYITVPEKKGLIYLLKGIAEFESGLFENAFESLCSSEGIYRTLYKPGRLFQIKVLKAGVFCLKGLCEEALTEIKEAEQYIFNFDITLREIDSLIHAAFVQYLCSGKITILDLERATSLFDLVKEADVKVKISWHVLFYLLGGSSDNYVDELFKKEETIKILIKILGFPFLKDESARASYSEILSKYCSTLLKEVLNKLNKI